MVIWWHTLSVIFAVVDASGVCPEAAPWYTIDLDLAPRDRWREVSTRHRDGLLELASWQRRALKNFGHEDLVEEYLKVQHVDIEYLEEMQGIVETVARPAEFDLRDVLLWNLNYELGTPRARGAGCTAILALDSKGRMLHGRNDDLPERNILAPISIGVSLRRKGAVVLDMAVFVGGVGTDTGLVHRLTDGWSISRNARLPHNETLVSKAWLVESIQAARRGGLVANFAFRDLMQSSGYSFQEAVEKLRTLPFSVPQYFAIAGAQDGVVLSLDRAGKGSADVWRLSPRKGQWFLVQTNLDHNATNGTSAGRRAFAHSTMNALGQDSMSPNRLLKVMGTWGVRDNLTTLTWISSISAGLSERPQLQAWPSSCGSESIHLV